jgi:hypothetical protein
MDDLTRRVLRVFIEMGKESLDLHTLFEAGGNDPTSRGDRTIGRPEKCRSSVKLLLLCLVLRAAPAITIRDPVACQHPLSLENVNLSVLQAKTLQLRFGELLHAAVDPKVVTFLSL